MRPFCIITCLVAGLAVLSCGPGSADQASGAADSTDSGIYAVGDPADLKYLITDNSVGYFRLGGSWQDMAITKYGYRSIQRYGRCTDACCDGGFLLGNKIVNGDYGKEMADLQVVIGAAVFSESQSETEFKDSPGVFYSSSPNCNAWYWSDKINYLDVASEQFHTKENMGAGSTLAEMQTAFGKLDFYVGWIEEDLNALQISVKAYPNIRFIVSVDDYKGNWEDIDMAGDKNSLSPADFKSGTKIRSLMVGGIR